MTLPARDWLYLAAIAVLVVFGLWLRQHLIAEGEARVLAHDQAAVALHDKDVADQKTKDEENARAVIGDLKAKLVKAAVDYAGQPLNPLRLCHSLGGDQGRTASSTAGQVQPGELAQRSPDSGVLAGDQSGDDVAADVRALAEAGSILAIYNADLYDWSVKQAQPLHAAAAAR